MLEYLFSCGLLSEGLFHLSSSSWALYCSYFSMTQMTLDLELIWKKLKCISVILYNVLCVIHFFIYYVFIYFTKVAQWAKCFLDEDNCKNTLVRWFVSRCHRSRYWECQCDYSYFIRLSVMCDFCTLWTESYFYPHFLYLFVVEGCAGQLWVCVGVTKNTVT